jgi:hypothetical protein
MFRKFSKTAVVLIGVLGVIATMVSCTSTETGISGQVLDEAKKAGRGAETFPAADEDYFKDMDGGVKLSAGEVQGRNTWLVWTGGNDRFWTSINISSVGALDFLKTISNSPALKCPNWYRNGQCTINRDIRWEYLGLVNEPCFEKPTEGDPKHFGLWLDKRIVDPGKGCPEDPFANEKKYPGVAIGARGKNIPAGSFYGEPTGIVGLRLFPNPDFDQKAAAAWDANRYYTDPSYYNQRNLVKPYRVGMSCAFCHVGPNPLKPPADADHPKWENLSSNVGAQYFWIERIFNWSGDASGYIYQMFHASKPGTLDTSLVSSDNINNPRTMNAVYQLKPRLERALLSGKETLSGGDKNNKQFNDFVKSDDPVNGWLTKFYAAPDTVYTPRVLKDGSDSVGGLGALNRVYLNIGLFSEEWLLHFNPLVGGKPVSPIEVAVARKNSTYWVATEQQTVNLALFFLKSTDPQKLQDAPGGPAHIDSTKLNAGKKVFADYCARCHSSKLPPIPSTVKDPGTCNGSGYLDCWNSYFTWTETADFKSAMEKIVTAPDFLKDNYLSSEFRVPVTLLETNACSPLATNALRDNIWDNFSSESYKQLPSVGEITYYDAWTGQPSKYKMPDGGRGFTRPASLVSLWSTAPFLLNNSVGKFEEQPSVEARLSSFEDSIDQMLNPEKRGHDSVMGSKMPLAANGLPLPSEIARTTERSYLRVARGYLPQSLEGLLGFFERTMPSVFGSSGIEIGPVPAGTPVNLIANLDVLGETTGFAKLGRNTEVLDLLVALKHDLDALPKNATDADAEKVFANLAPRMMKLSKCPDFIVNRGHYFGTSYFTQEKDIALAPDQKKALIEFLKTF